MCIRVIYLFVHFIYTICVRARCWTHWSWNTHHFLLLLPFLSLTRTHIIFLLLLLWFVFLSLLIAHCIEWRFVFYLAILQLPTYTHVCIVMGEVCVHWKWENNRFSEQTHTFTNTQWTRKRRLNITRNKEKMEKKTQPKHINKTIAIFMHYFVECRWVNENNGEKNYYMDYIVWSKIKVFSGFYWFFLFFIFVRNSNRLIE